MVKPAILFLRFEAIAQDIEIVKKIPKFNEDDEIEDYNEESIPSKGFIDYTNKTSEIGERGGTNTQGVAQLYTKYDVDIKIKDIVVDQVKNKWIVRGFITPIHDHKKRPLFKQYSLSLIDDNNNQQH